MTDIILVKTKKTSLNLSEHQNVTNYTPTVHTVQLDVHVACIAKDKTYIFPSIQHSHQFSAFQDGQTLGVECTLQLICLHFFIKEAVSNSELFVFYSEQHHIIHLGF